MHGRRRDDCGSMPWPQQTNLWREQTNPQTRRVRLSDISLKVIWEKQLNKHILSPPQAELEALASPILRSGPLSSLRYGGKV